MLVSWLSAGVVISIRKIRENRRERRTAQPQPKEIYPSRFKDGRRVETQRPHSRGWLVVEAVVPTACLQALGIRASAMGILSSGFRAKIFFSL